MQQQEGVVKIGERDIFYRVQGSGPPLLLLHGFLADGSSWWDHFLDEFIENYTVIVPDLPGHGRSTNPSGKFTHHETAEALYQLLDSLQIKRFSGIGHSSGGIVLLHMATLQPERVVGLVNISGNPRLPRGREYPALEDLSTELRDYLLRVHPRGPGQVRTLIHQFRNLGTPADDLPRDELENIKAPTLIVWGDRDPNPIARAVEMHQSIPESALWILPTQGHFPFWKEWGGAPRDIEIFPGVVMEFFGVLETE